MNEPVCECGHNRDEHLKKPSGWKECDVEDCDCILYNWNHEDDDD